uniref:Uncharacterized protein n=1 Tax=Rhodnius prolixus TaxID=13249 RepID=T1HSD8_RHOPR
MFRYESFWKLMVGLCVTYVVNCSDSFEHRHSLQLWTKVAFDWLQQELCTTCSLPGSSNDVRLYAALPTHLGKLRPIAADSSTRHARIHDSILVLDPKPSLRFGHPVFMFFIDLNMTVDQCTTSGGRLLEGKACLQPWRRARCHRRAPSRRGGCHLVYLPEVRLVRESGSPIEHNNEDLLECRIIPGFHQTCPQRRKEPTSPGICNPLATNTKSCDTTSYLRTHCHFMQTCDHAVLISGGWNRQLSDEYSLQNALTMNKVLINHGFLENNIRIFFANGIHQEDMVSFSPGGVIYPSGLKLALRYHLRTLCEKRHCADSLVIYMNSPARPDGASLLWDVDSNGEFDETEVYTVRELLRDLENCKARRTILLVDQSYGGEIVRQALHKSTQLSNTVVVSWGGSSSHNNELVTLLKRLYPEASHPPSSSTICLNQLAQISSERITFVGLRRTQLNVTLSGGPCYKSGEAHNDHDSGGGGCQNLSTLELLEDGIESDGFENRFFK